MRKNFLRHKTSCFLLVLMLSIAVCSCNKPQADSKGCVVAFILSAEQHDMTKAWGLLGPDAQAYYNNMGEKQRRSGKGAMENEINKIKSFRSAKKDYKIQGDKNNTDVVKIVTIAGPEHIVETVNENGDYKIKDWPSVKNILDCITAEENNNKGY
jgi:hypothetical protein